MKIEGDARIAVGAEHRPFASRAQTAKLGDFLTHIGGFLFLNQADY
jgi:hypothetical protein